LSVRVSQQTADGPALPGAEVDVATLASDGSVLGQPVVRFTDAAGFVHLSYREPVALALQAVAKQKADWTREGTRVQVGTAIIPERALLVSDRDLFLPLYRSHLDFAANTTWSTVVAQPDAGGMIDPAHTEADLGFPDGLQVAYLSRLVAARVELHWDDTATAHANLAAGLSWSGNLWVQGDEASPGLVPGARSALYQGDLPVAGRPVDLAATRLQAAALTHSAVVGDMPLGFTATLLFGGQSPAELPAPCSHALLC
jgi:hypothetical protein